MDTIILKERLAQVVDDLSKLISMELDFLNDGDGSWKEGLEERLNSAKELDRKVDKAISGGTPLIVSVVGDYNSGKSSFINCLLGEDYCPVKCNPTTSFITRFIYGPKLEIEAIEGDSPPRNLCLDEYHQFVQKDEYGGDKVPGQQFLFNFYLPNDILKNMILVDTPGFNNEKSIDDLDGKITDKQIDKSDILLWVSNISQPTLTKNTCDRLNNIKSKSRSPIIVDLINQADLKTPKARSSILADRREDIHNYFSGHFMFCSKLNGTYFKPGNNPDVTTRHGFLLKLYDLQEQTNRRLMQWIEEEAYNLEVELTQFLTRFRNSVRTFSSDAFDNRAMLIANKHEFEQQFRWIYLGPRCVDLIISIFNEVKNNNVCILPVPKEIKSYWFYPCHGVYYSPVDISFKRDSIDDFYERFTTISETQDQIDKIVEGQISWLKREFAEMLKHQIGSGIVFDFDFEATEYKEKKLLENITSWITDKASGVLDVHRECREIVEGYFDKIISHLSVLLKNTEDVENRISKISRLLGGGQDESGDDKDSTCQPVNFY